jgi:hypothetical protein
MPDNRSVCAKCGQIYGEPYAPQCDCFYEAQKNERAYCCPICGLPFIYDGQCDAPQCSCDVLRNQNVIIKEKKEPSLTQNVKDSNPKDAVGIKKVPFSTVPAPVIAEIGLAMLEGSRKYRRHNYRAIGVRASVYVDACMRHLTAWWEGESIDPDSGLSHLVKAMACLVVLRDAQILDKVVDDRPPKHKDGWIQELNKKAKEIIERYPEELEPYTELNQKKETSI